MSEVFVLYTSNPIDRKAMAALADWYSTQGESKKAAYLWEILRG